jgi:hypothetical protein
MCLCVSKKSVNCVLKHPKTFGKLGFMFVKCETPITNY